MIGVSFLVAVVLGTSTMSVAATESRERRSAQQSYQAPQQTSYHAAAPAPAQEYKKGKLCYQCAYSPPKTVYEKKDSYGQQQYGGHANQVTKACILLNWTSLLQQFIHNVTFCR